MIVTPAIDLRGGRCVQLVGGSYDRQLIEIDDPVAVARRWEREGFATLHVVDLDAATGRGSNIAIVEEILENGASSIQVGGGIRTTEAVEEMLAAGATRVVVGTRAIEDNEWLEEISTLFPQRILVALDVRGRTVVTHGWASDSTRNIEEQLEMFTHLPLAGLLVTAVHVEGLMKGPDVALMREIVSISAHPLQASGGITSYSDVSDLAEIGVASVVVGMALYTGALSAAELEEEWKR